MAWSYSVFDTVHKPTVKELQEQYIQKGIDSSCAFSMACADYEKSTYRDDRVLHKISDEELKAIPKEFKDKPSGVGRYFWRAPSYQHLEIDGCAQLILIRLYNRSFLYYVVKAAIIEQIPCYTRHMRDS